ncbi:MAG: hypothetical protein K6C40_15195 [Thermoguttaceae bacterium]|nr:hypothetical protein [Thermoguttaceae bacterium]
MSNMLKDYRRLSGNGGNVKRGFMIIMRPIDSDISLEMLLMVSSPGYDLTRRYIRIARNWNNYSEQEKRDIIAATKKLISAASWGARILTWIT